MTNEQEEMVYFERDFKKTEFYFNMKISIEKGDTPYLDIFEKYKYKYRNQYFQLSFEVWLLAVESFSKRKI
jgi:hypothetical protein